MKVVLLLCLVETAFQQDILGTALPDFAKEFDRFIKTFKPIYKHASDQQARFKIFKNNYLELLQIKAKQSRGQLGNVEFGMTKFMDWSKAEKAKLNGVRNVPKADTRRYVIPPSTLRAKQLTPSSYDWHTYNKVTSVKDQGQCGSCWAFAATAVIESAISIKNGSLLDLSEQHLVSCVSQSYGCLGGWPQDAFAYARTNGIASEADYPYTATDGTCKTVGGQSYITDWWYVGTDESQLTTQLYNRGPLVYTMRVPDSMFYLTNSSGVYHPSVSDCQTAIAAHAVTVVGYGSDSSGTPYWLIKNSWGTSWGNSGYFKLYRGDQTCSMGMSMWAASATAAEWTCSNVDDENSCKHYQRLGYCASNSLYYEYMQNYCRAACGFCSSG